MQFCPHATFFRVSEHEEPVLQLDFRFLFRDVMAHALLVMETLVPLQEIVDILHPVFTRMNPVNAWHGEGGHTHLQELVFVQEECLLAIQ
jgi:hypothetical protein